VLEGIVAKFTVEEVVAVASIQQLINEWARDLDLHNGLHIGALVTDDAEYVMGPITRKGRADVELHYKERLARLTAEPTGVPTMRHSNSNLCVSFDRPDAVSITFSLLYFSTAGMSSGLLHADPAAVADVRMKCRKDADGHWRISRFDSNQTFKRVIA
jgi:ketosteroid isomerase-like protein